MTANRKLILQLLAEPIDGSPPPHCASTLLYALENAFKYDWDGYAGMKSIPRKEQVHRTLRDLLAAGLVVVERQKDDPISDGLPCWVNYFQLAGDVEKNAIIAECEAIHRKVKRAKYGSRLFTSVFDMGIPAGEVPPLMKQVKVMMQKTHPDKIKGLEHEFKLMQECRRMIKSGLPLPVPTHEAGAKVPLTLTKA